MVYKLANKYMMNRAWFVHHMRIECPKQMVSTNLYNSKYIIWYGMYVLHYYVTQVRTVLVLLITFSLCDASLILNLR